MRRAAVIALAALVVIGGVAAVLLVLGGQDEPELAVRGPGRLEPDRGAGHDRAARRSAPSAPDTSGPHRPELPEADARELSDDAHLHLLELGNVVLHYAGAAPPPALRALQEEVSGAYEPDVAAAGQAVALARRPGLGPGVLATAWRRRLRTERADDPALRDFVDRWLGQGA